MDIDDIYLFLRESQGVGQERLTPDVDLRDDLGIDGDDYFELAQQFERKYEVDMSSYHWYFHHGEEGFNIGSIIFRAPHQMVNHIPVTPKVLLQAANTKVWPIKYPKHHIPRVRHDFKVNLIIVGCIVLVAALWLIA